MLPIYLSVIFLRLNLAVAEIEIFQPFLVSPRSVYTFLPSAQFPSNSLPLQFPGNGYITGSSTPTFTSSEYTTKISPPHCSNNGLITGCSTSQLFGTTDLLTGSTATSSDIPTSLRAAAIGELPLPSNGYDTGSALQSTVINDGRIHNQPATAQGYILQEPIADYSSNPYLSGDLPLSSNGFVSSTRSSTLKAVEGNTYLQPPTVPGYLQQQPVLSVAPNPAIELFVNSLTQTLTSSNLLKDFVVFEHQAPRDLLHGVGYDILSTAGINNPDLPEIVAQVGDSIGKLSSRVYLDAQTRTVAKFLDSKGLLSVDNVYTLSQSFLNYAENRANAKAVVDTESFVSAVVYGFFDFIRSLGYLFDDTYEEVYKLFSEELKTAHLNAASL